MKLTIYAILPTDELIAYSLLRDNHTAIEVELAQRLSIATDFIAQNFNQGDDDGNDTRGTHEARRKKMA